MAEEKLNLIQKLAKIRAISDVAQKNKKGYNYSVITLEKSWQLGHDDKGYLDIMIKNPSNNDIYMVEVKTSETIKKYVDNKHEKDTKQVLYHVVLRDYFESEVE